MTELSAEEDVVGISDSDYLSLEVVFDLLANERRRRVLACLIGRTAATEFDELAEEVAARENGATAADISRETVRTINTSLYHAHIPKLEAAGVVEFDQDRELVRISENDDRVERFLSLAADGGEVH